MAAQPKEKDKFLRVQGPRSHNGCLTCKLKHVKCDETRPNCLRCIRTKQTCHYTGHALHTPASRIVVYSVPQSLDQYPELPPKESRGLWHFCHRTSKQLGGAFRNELWSMIMPQLMHNDWIVRHAVLALSAFHEHYLDNNSSDPGPINYAMCLFERAQQQIIKLKTPHDSFDSILGACIIFCACESLQGKYEEATRHAVAGMKIIAGQGLSKLSTTSVFRSNGHIMSNVFLGLQTLVIEANVSEFEITCPGLDSHLGDVPESFITTEDALPYFQDLSNQVLKLYQDADEHHEQYPWFPSQVSPLLLSQYKAIQTRYNSWAKALLRSQFGLQTGDAGQNSGHLLMRIRASLLEIDLHIFAHGENTYDSMEDSLWSILNFTEEFLAACSSPSSSTNCMVDPAVRPGNIRRASFSFSPEIVPLLFEIATRTNHHALRQRAIQLLRTSNRREGVWDGAGAAILAEKIVELKEQGSLIAETSYYGHKFLITDILLLSERKCMVRYGFKEIKANAFCSFWLETINPGQGVLHSYLLDIN